MGVGQAVLPKAVTRRSAQGRASGRTLPYNISYSSCLGASIFGSLRSWVQLNYWLRQELGLHQLICNARWLGASSTLPLYRDGLRFWGLTKGDMMLLLVILDYFPWLLMNCCVQHCFHESVHFKRISRKIILSLFSRVGRWMDSIEPKNELNLLSWLWSDENAGIAGMTVKGSWCQAVCLVPDAARHWQPHLMLRPVLNNQKALLHIFCVEMIAFDTRAICLKQVSAYNGPNRPEGLSFRILEIAWNGAPYWNASNRCHGTAILHFSAQAGCRGKSSSFFVLMMFVLSYS